MRCSGCGKDIPFSGEVCPHCLRDKSGDQTATVAGFAGLIIGGGIGGLIFGFEGALIGGILLAVVFMAMVMSGTESKPPTVRTERQSVPKSTRPQAASEVALSEGRDDMKSTRSRLSELREMLNDGLITKDEFEKKRSDIIERL